MTELLVGTKKGLFVLEGDPGAGFEVTARAFAGEPVEYALRDPRSGRVLAAVVEPVLRPEGVRDRRPRRRVGAGDGHRAARRWRERAGADLDPAARRGRRPGLRRRRSRRPVREPRRRHELRAQPRAVGAPHAAEVAAGRRRAVPALDRDVARRPGPARDRDLGRRRVADRRRRREPGARATQGLRPRYLPEDTPEDEVGLCVHRLRRHPKQPERIFMQFHGGVYRSDDAGESWSDIAPGLPSDFGFPLAIDPADPDSAYVIPLVADMDRVTPEGRVRVYETRDAGASWAPRGDGLPERARVPDHPARGVRAHGRGRRARALLRLDLGRGVRLGRRRRELVRRRRQPPARVFRGRVLDSSRWARRRALPRPGTRSSATSTCGPTRPTSARARPRRRRSRRRGWPPAPRAASCSTCPAGSAATRSRSPAPATG